MTGKVTNDHRDLGGRTRWGIAERFHRDLTATGFFDGMSNEDSLALTHDIYKREYANPLQLALVESQKVANALMSFAVNEGVKTSVLILQRMLQEFKPHLVVDGDVGPATLSVLNALPEYQILSLLGIYQRKHYYGIVNGNPTQTAFLGGWINRVKQNCEA